MDSNEKKIKIKRKRLSECEFGEHMATTTLMNIVVQCQRGNLELERTWNVQQMADTDNWPKKKHNLHK